MKIAIIGGGVSGLVAAYYLSQNGIDVSVFEKEKILGGLAGSFLMDGRHIERYYHFICLNDYDLLGLLQELGLAQRLRWVNTKMGLFYNGRLYPFGEPLDLLLFPGFSFLDKLRFGWGILYSKGRSSTHWKKIEHIPAPEWLVAQFGRKSYEIIHKPLIELKFGSYASQLSAAWIWARIHRLGKSRTRLTQKERLGYIEGGTHTLISKLEEEIVGKGGRICKEAHVQQITVEANKVTGLVCDGQTYDFDAVISTVPSVVFLNLLPGLTNDYLARLAQIDSIGVVCMLLRLKKPFSKFFWTNISDPRMSLAGLIEYTNLNPRPDLGDAIIYLPQYLPSTSDRYRIDDEQLFLEYTRYLNLMKPDFTSDWVEDYYVFRDEYAQPIAEVGFSEFMPEIQTPIEGLYMTDSCQLHPDDRTVSNSIGLGKRVSDLVITALKR